MHVACIQGRADVVRLLIARAQDNLLKKSLKDILNAKTLKVSCTYIYTYIICCIGSHSGNVCRECPHDI